MTKVIVFDTETTNSIEEPLIYDIGWAVIDTDTHEVIKTESYAVADIFLDKELMSSAYYVEKVPQYWEEIKLGNRKLARLYTIRKTFLADIKAYGIKELYAHNARFDFLSCTLTQRFITCSKYRHFFPYGIKIYDTLKMSREALKNSAEYKEFCTANGYKTKNGQCRYTAEVLYRFLTDNTDFEEVHKGIDDVLIEKEILFMCHQYGIIEGMRF